MRSGLTPAIALENSKNEFPLRLEPVLSVEVFSMTESVPLQNRPLEFTP